MTAARLSIPSDAIAAIDAYRTCEFLTVTRAARRSPGRRSASSSRTARSLISTSIGLPQKAFNVRRNPAVALLFSDPTASGLDGAPAVLVQGTASCPDEIVTSVLRAREVWLRILERQPASGRTAATRSPVG